MPWTVVYGYAATKEQQANPPEHILQTRGPFDSKQAAMDHAIMRVNGYDNIVVIKDGAGEVVADFDEVWAAAAARRSKPAGS